MVDPFFCEQYTCILFTDPTNSIFINFFIKNRSHGTIYIFKNYLVTVFSVFSFSKISSIQTDPKSTCYIIGDGTSVNVWEDPWIPGVQGFKSKPQSEDTSLTPLNVSQLLDHSTNQKKHIHTNREGERHTQSALKNSHTPMSIIIGCHTHTWLCHKHTYPWVLLGTHCGTHDSCKDGPRWGLKGARDPPRSNFFFFLVIVIIYFVFVVGPLPKP